MGDIILDFNKVTKTFPGVTALDKVSFTVQKGEIHAICGENGAGKSTLMNILAGVIPFGTYTGHVVFDGTPLQFVRDAIHEAGKKGIAIVHQELALVPQMTVGENIFLGREPSRAGVINWNKLYSDTLKTLDDYPLELSFDSKIKDLSVGKQQMVEIAKALSKNAKVLILDEPTSALTDAEVGKLMTILRRLRGQGVTCLYISHKLEEVFEIADRITVIRDGKVIATAKTTDTRSEKIISLMVGRQMTERFPGGKRRPGDVVLRVANLTAEHSAKPGKAILKDISFSLRQGEILGIAGLMGSGRSELVTALFGEFGCNIRAEVQLNGQAVAIRSARDAMRAGISLVPEDRKRLGLIIEQSILKNISLPNLDRFAGFGSLKKHEERQHCEAKAADLAIKSPTLHALVSSLSGGNQQKVVIAKWLLRSPKVLILDEPTRGIDVGAKYEIYKLMNQLAAEGVGIIMVSSELPEVLGMSDRIMVMHEGAVAGVLPKKFATQEIIMSLATGLDAPTVKQVA